MDEVLNELLELQQQFIGAKQYEEGDTTFYFIPNLRMPLGCTPLQTDVLLCPIPRDGYPSRLYFAEQVQGPTNQNWNGKSYILGKEWHAFSWSDIQGLRLTELVLAYMRALLA